MDIPSIIAPMDYEQVLRNRAAEGSLLTLRMDIINKCNLQCVMCGYSDPAISRRRAVSISADQFFSGAYCERPFTEVMIRNQTEVLPSAWHQKILGVLDENTRVEDVFFGKKFAALRAGMLKGEIDEGCRQCPVKTGFLPVGIKQA